MGKPSKKMQGAGNGQRSASPQIIAWMIVVGCAELTAQIIRLQQTDPTAWLYYDYAGRLAVLALLAANPAVRTAVYRPERLKISLAVVINWGLLLIPILCAARIVGQLYAAFLPTFRLGTYPRPDGWLSTSAQARSGPIVVIHYLADLWCFT